MREELRTDNGTVVNTTMEEKVMRSPMMLLNSMEDAFGIYIDSKDMADKYLRIAEGFIENGFDFTDLKRIANAIFYLSWVNKIDIYDIDFSNTSINKKCILFESYIEVYKDRVRLELYIRFNYHNKGFQFIEGSVSNYDKNISKYVNTFDRLKEVINEFSTQRD